jgi:predicted phage-related endonuclease
MLTEEQQAARAGKITASFLPRLMAGDEEAIYREWLRLTEHPDYAPEDLSDVWAVQLGSYMETFALDWHERKTGHPLNYRGRVIVHPEMEHVCCTLDAYRGLDDTVIDCKVVGHWRKIEDVCSLYTPQMVVQRACTGADHAALLIVHGGAEPTEHPIEWDSEYETAVWTRVDWFWNCVSELVPPVAVKPVEAPVVPVRTVDMATNNMWSEQAAIWLANKEAAVKFTKAQDQIKSLIPADAKKAYGKGIEASRDTRGSIRIRESKS